MCEVTAVTCSLEQESEVFSVQLTEAIGEQRRSCWLTAERPALSPGAISLSHRLTGLSGFAFVIRKTENEIEVFVFTHMIK